MNITIPNALTLFKAIQDIEKDLLQTTIPSEAGPILLQRYNTIYLLVLAYRAGYVNNSDIELFIHSDSQAQSILKELHALPETETRKPDAEGSVVFAKGGILRKFTKHNGE